MLFSYGKIIAWRIRFAEYVGLSMRNSDDNFTLLVDILLLLLYYHSIS
jgi:hypothetical protein